MNLDVDKVSLEERNEELTTDELKDLQKKQRQDFIEDFRCRGGGSGAKVHSFNKIKDVLAKWEEVKTFSEKIILIKHSLHVPYTCVMIMYCCILGAF